VPTTNATKSAQNAQASERESQISQSYASNVIAVLARAVLQAGSATWSVCSWFISRGGWLPMKQWPGSSNDGGPGQDFGTGQLVLVEQHVKIAERP
jgi:hypothetical protein